MTKTHAELLHCPHCGKPPKYTVESCHDYENGGTDYYENIFCDNENCDSRHIVECWNMRVNKEAEFLEELKNGCNEIMQDTASKVPSRAVPTLETQFELGKREAARAILKFIEQFQAEQKVSDEK